METGASVGNTKLCRRRGVAFRIQCLASAAAGTANNLQISEGPQRQPVPNHRRDQAIPPSSPSKLPSLNCLNQRSSNSIAQNTTACFTAETRQWLRALFLWPTVSQPRLPQYLQTRHSTLQTSRRPRYRKRTLGPPYTCCFQHTAPCWTWWLSRPARCEGRRTSSTRIFRLRLRRCGLFRILNFLDGSW